MTDAKKGDTGRSSGRSTGGATDDGTDPHGSADGDAISFTDALDELNTIVAQLEAEEVDVDVMTQNVERAAFLVGLCRDRLDSTRYKVEEIIVGLDPRAPQEPQQDQPS